MTPLEELIRGEIESDGPIPVSRYMALALGHPQHGYYITRNPLGRDFTTAPEVSQMFGELLGAWLADIWQQMGAPGEVRVIELGPGRGTLMADALRVLPLVPELAKAARIHLVETSPYLRDTQARTVGAAAEKAGMRPPEWHSHLGEVPEGPTLLLANEFFDALPVRQFVRTQKGWHERCVALDPAEGRFIYALAPDAAPADAFLAPVVLLAREGAVAEIRPAAEGVATLIAQRLTAHGGAALIADYGHMRSAPGDTLQAMRAGDYAEVLADPGDADITAHVDFEALAQAFRDAGAIPHGPVAQGTFLEALGIAARAEYLMEKASQRQAGEIETALARLTAPQAMGTLFKVLGVTSEGLVPAGFPS